MFYIHCGSLLTSSFHKVENFLKIKSVALCSLMKLISALIHNKASILLFGQGLATLIMLLPPAGLHVISYSYSLTSRVSDSHKLSTIDEVLALEPLWTEKRLLPWPENSNSEGVHCSEEVEHLGDQVTWSRYLSLTQSDPGHMVQVSESQSEFMHCPKLVTVHKACLSWLPTPVSRNCMRLQGAG